MKRYEYINIGLSLGISPTAILTDLTPAELQDLLRLRKKQIEESKAKKEGAKK